MTRSSETPPVMVLAAGLGTRMRPLTDTTPKPLIKVGGSTMLDRVLDTFARAGTQNAVINTHYLAAQIEAHSAARVGNPTIALSPEPGERLETGGGVARALPLLGDTFFTTNSDSFWVGDEDAIFGMREVFDPSMMDMLLLLAPRQRCVGLGKHPGDFELIDDGTLVRRGHLPVPYNYTGTALMSASLFTDLPEGAFSLNVLFDRAIARRKLYGYILRGLWLTVGTPEAIDEAESALKEAGHS